MCVKITYFWFVNTRKFLGGMMHDRIRFIRKLTFAKVTNAVRVVLSYYLSHLNGKAMHRGMPMSISVEPTTSCNLRCPECPSGKREFTRPIGMLQETLFKKLIDELHGTLMYLVFYFQGEPYLNPNFLDMVQYANKRGIYTATSTNAHYLTAENAEKTIKSGLSRIIISIDGTNQETYEKYRVGGSLAKVLEGTKNMVECKKKMKSRTPHIVFQFLVVRHNEHQLEEIKRIAKAAGVNEIRFKTAQVYDYENGNKLIPINPKYARYTKTSKGKYVIKNKLLNHCWRLWHASVVTWDGRVVPCCFDKDATHQMGEFGNVSFSEIWKGLKYRNFRDALLKSRSEIDICKNCSEGTKVWT